MTETAERNATNTRRRLTGTPGTVGVALSVAHGLTNNSE
jgi:hypothetical protein